MGNRADARGADVGQTGTVWTTGGRWGRMRDSAHRPPSGRVLADRRVSIATAAVYVKGRRRWHCTVDTSQFPRPKARPDIVQ